MVFASKMTYLLLPRLIILFVVVGISSAIQPEYYFDTEEQADNNKVNASKSDDEKILSQNDTPIYDSNDDRTKYNNDSNLRRVASENTSIPTTSSAATTLGNNTINYKAILRNLNTFPGYDYADDVTTSHEQLRFDNSSDESDNTTEPIDESTDDHVNATYNNSIKYLADFFNLDPASSKVDIKNGLLKNYKGSEYLWYVPEKLPCWNLPVVVGRLSKRRSMSGVFRVYSDRLTDVLPIGDQGSLRPRYYLVPSHRKTANKWCNNAPCFGDHSLCIFSDKTFSKICDVGYHISRPSKLEKISIVNTINSMRNSIASGSVEIYRHLPTAADMQQILYDTDLEEMALAWLRQCLPGIDPCSSLSDEYVTQLECTKCAENCCLNLQGADVKATW